MQRAALLEMDLYCDVICS